MQEERLNQGVRYLESCGYRVKLGSAVHEQHGYLAGEDVRRIQDLNAMFLDPEVRAVFSVRGGYGTPRILHLLDYRAIRENPKILVGYSDITALQLAIFQRTGMVTFSGPMVAVEMAKGIDPFTESHFWRMLTEDSSGLKLEAQGPGASVKSGRAEGRLLGGCLSLIGSLVGSAYLPDFKDAILFVEDIGEEPYKIDRHLSHLRLAGILDKISGLVCGHFVDCEPKGDSPSLTLDEVIADFAAELPIPVLRNLPYGHIDVKYTLPLGVEARLDADAGTLELLESPVV